MLPDWIEKTDLVFDNMEALQKEIHAEAKAKGWWEEGKTSIVEKLALIHSEVSEALEEYRVRETPLNQMWWQDPDVSQTFSGYEAPPGVKPEGFGVELADVVIRVFDLAEWLGIDLANAIKVKMKYNKTRPYRHGNKKA